MSTTRANMFDDIDRMDADAWASYLADDVVMRFGNAEETQGRQVARDGLAAFYELIDGVSHALREQWLIHPATIVESDVTYTRKDGRAVTVPCVTIYRTDVEDLISDYRVYIDLAPVFAEG